MPTGFRRTEIKACVYRDGKPAPRIVTALVKGNFAAHRMLLGEPWTDSDGIEHDGTAGGWTVTHVPTGLSIRTFDTQREAKQLVEQLATAKLPRLGTKLGEDTSTKWSDRTRKQVMVMTQQAG